MSEGLRIWIQLLGMYIAQNVRMFTIFGETFGFFGLMGAEQLYAYQQVFKCWVYKCWVLSAGARHTSAGFTCGCGWLK